MFSHITIGTQDLARAEAFYDAVLEPLGIRRVLGNFPDGRAGSGPGRLRSCGSASLRMARWRATAMAGWLRSRRHPAPRLMLPIQPQSQQAAPMKARRACVPTMPRTTMGLTCGTPTGTSCIS